jgi:Na+-transporting NADH:ubiquinone oxidoreductase subunit NqrB
MGWIEKNLRKIFDAPRKHFESGGRLEKLGPLFEAIEDVFFFPAEATKNRPLVRDSLDLKRFMSSVLVALIPPLLFGIYNTGYHSRLASEMSTAFMPSFLPRVWALFCPSSWCLTQWGFSGSFCLPPSENIPSARDFWSRVCCFP